MASETTADSSQQATASPPDENWATETMKNWFGLKLGEQAWMLDKWQQQQAVVMDDVRRARGDTSGSSETPAEGTDMGVSVGNKVTNNYHYAPQASETTTQQAVQSAAAGGLSTAAKAALIAAVVGSGGLGAGGVALLNWLNQPQVTVNQPTQDTDTNSALEIGE